MGIAGSVGRAREKRGTYTREGGGTSSTGEEGAGHIAHGRKETDLAAKRDMANGGL